MKRCPKSYAPIACFGSNGKLLMATLCFYTLPKCDVTQNCLVINIQDHSRLASTHRDRIKFQLANFCDVTKVMFARGNGALVSFVNHSTSKTGYE